MKYHCEVDGGSGKSNKYTCECGSVGSTDAVDQYGDPTYRKSTYSPAEMSDRINSLYDRDLDNKRAIDFLMKHTKIDKALIIAGILVIASLVSVIVSLWMHTHE